MRALTKDEASALEAADPPRATRPPRLTDEQDRLLKDVLAADGRTPASAIAERLGISPRQARDAVAALRASGQLVIRVDVARSCTPWPVYAWYFLHVPPSLVARVGPALSRMEAVRLVVTTIGRHNVIMAVWLRTLGDVGRLEAMLEERLPGVSIADRSLVLRTVKHMGHLLDADGHPTGETVPLPY
jgi:DNA-binding Lrp family transcriptional regulator